LLYILKMSNVVDFFNLIPMKLLLEEMLNMMKISWPTSLIQCLCHLRTTSHFWHFCDILFLFPFLLLQMMTVRMKIHLFLLTFLHIGPLNRNLHQNHRFRDGFVQHKKQLVILSMILQINARHIHSARKPLLFCIKFQIFMIQKHLKKLWAIQIGTQQ
jgi:hypothetical protein